jgi:hypothetical protein
MCIIIIHLSHEYYLAMTSKKIKWKYCLVKVLYEKMIAKIGQPILLDKEEHGAIWTRGKKLPEFRLRDTESLPLSTVFHVKLFDGFTNVIVTEEAVIDMKEEIYNYGAVIMSSKTGDYTVRIAGNDCDELFEKIETIKQICSHTLGIT